MSGKEPSPMVAAEFNFKPGEAKGETLGIAELDI